MGSLAIITVFFRCGWLALPPPPPPCWENTLNLWEGFPHQHGPVVAGKKFVTSMVSLSLLLPQAGYLPLRNPRLHSERKGIESCAPQYQKYGVFHVSQLGKKGNKRVNRRYQQWWGGLLVGSWVLEYASTLYGVLSFGIPSCQLF